MTDIEEWDPKWNPDQDWDPAWIAEFGGEWDSALRREYVRDASTPTGKAKDWYDSVCRGRYVPKARSVARAIAGLCHGGTRGRVTGRQIAEIATGGRKDAVKISMDALARAGLIEYCAIGRGRGSYTEVRLVQPDLEPQKRGCAKGWGFEVAESEFDFKKAA